MYVFKAPVTPYRIGETDGNQTKSGEIHQCPFSIYLPFGVSIPHPMTFGKPNRHFWTLSNLVCSGSHRVVSMVLIWFESTLSILSGTHPLRIRFVYWYSPVNVTSRNGWKPNKGWWNQLMFVIYMLQIWPVHWCFTPEQQGQAFFCPLLSVI